MTILTARGIGKSFGSRSLFSDVSFDVSEKDRIGLVGANGTGKTTLLKILAGEQQSDGGEIQKAKLLKISTLEQTAQVRENETVYEFALDAFKELMTLESALEKVNSELLKSATDELIQKQHNLREKYERDGGLTYKSRARSALIGLGFTERELSLPVSALSGGNINKAMLARALMCGEGLLLLDEPTNHLDVQATEWLEACLKSYSGAFIVISHDRYFLDKVTDRTFELRSDRLLISSGNYSVHMEKRENENECVRRKYYNTQREIRRICGIVEQQRRWNRERNIRMAESKLKQIEKLKETLVAPIRESDSVRFNFTAKKQSGSDVLIAEELSKSYGAKSVFSGIPLHIRSGERVFLLGPNGCGKTTLMRVLMGREKPDAGFSYFGAEVEPAYYEQDMRSLRPDNTILAEVHDAFPRMSTGEVRNALAAFLFRGDDVNKRVETLSGGEKARVQLLKLMLSGANMLLLDEPTNHLDIASREALERALEEYEGAMLIVTHDRYLTNRVADRVLYMSNGKITETIGGYDAFIASLNNPEAQNDDLEQKQKNAYHIKKEKQSTITKAKTALRKAEEAVSREEDAIAALERELLAAVSNNSGLDTAAVHIRAMELDSELMKRRAGLNAYYQDWEHAETELARYEHGCYDLGTLEEEE